MIKSKHLCRVCALILSIAMMLTMTVSVFASSVYVIFVYSDNTSSYVVIDSGSEIGSNLPATSSGYHWEDDNGSEVTSSTVVGTSTLYVYEVADSSTPGTEEYYPINGVNYGGGSSYYNASTSTVTLGTNGWSDCIGWWFGSSSTLNLESITITLDEAATDYTQLQVIYTDDTITSYGFGSWSGTTITVDCEDNTIKQIYLQSGTLSTLTFVSVTYVERTSAGSQVEPSTSSATRFIYVDSTYHALIVDGHLISSEHEVDSDGYCTVCKEYIGTEEETTGVTTETVEINEPVEGTDTDIESDDVDVNDTDDETPAEETNPTTGVVIALIPMAIAGLAVVSSKRK